MNANTKQLRLGHLAGSENSPLRRVLANSVFDIVSDDEFPHLVMRLEEVEYDAGTEVFVRGQAADYLYFVATGNCELLRESGEGLSAPIGQVLRPGDMFGDDILSAEQTYSLTARMSRGGRVLRIDAAYIRQIFASIQPVDCGQEVALAKISQGAQWFDLRSSAGATDYDLDTLRTPFEDLFQNSSIVLVAPDTDGPRVFQMMLLMTAQCVDCLWWASDVMPNDGEGIQADVDEDVEFDESAGEIAAEANAMSSGFDFLKSELDETRARLEQVQCKLEHLTELKVVSSATLPVEGQLVTDYDAPHALRKDQASPSRLTFCVIAGMFAGFSAAVLLGLVW